jgi:putative FmdB family regulatory protein
MPIYEFYCSDCHKIYKFLARRLQLERAPGCPGCGREKLERQVSLFAVARRRGKEPEGADDGVPEPDIDESKLEDAMRMLEGEAEGIDEEDPRQAARLMRKLYGATGLKLGPTMEEAIRRMEAGEDPESIEGELGDALESEDPFLGEGGLKDVKALRRRLAPPAVDDTLYDL